MSHEYLKGLHIEDDEPTRDRIPELEFEFENHRLNGEQLKGIYNPNPYCKLFLEDCLWLETILHL